MGIIDLVWRIMSRIANSIFAAYAISLMKTDLLRQVFVTGIALRDDGVSKRQSHNFQCHTTPYECDSSSQCDWIMGCYNYTPWTTPAQKLKALKILEVNPEATPDEDGYYNNIDHAAEDENIQPKL